MDHSGSSSFMAWIMLAPDGPQAPSATAPRTLGRSPGIAGVFTQGYYS